MDIDRIAQLFDLRLEPREATTVGGLVSELMGRIPEPGAVVEDEGLRFEVLDSTDRRIERVRISRLGVREPNSNDQPPQARAPRQKEPRTAKRA